jgi:hypothetical protein
MFAIAKRLIQLEFDRGTGIALTSCVPLIGAHAELDVRGSADKRSLTEEDR